MINFEKKTFITDMKSKKAGKVKTIPGIIIKNKLLLTILTKEVKFTAPQNYLSFRNNPPIPS
jgi:hypothetical protein